MNAPRSHALLHPPNRLTDRNPCSPDTIIYTSDHIVATPDSFHRSSITALNIVHISDGIIHVQDVCASTHLLVRYSIYSLPRGLSRMSCSRHRHDFEPVPLYR